MGSCMNYQLIVIYEDVYIIRVKCILWVKGDKMILYNIVTLILFAVKSVRCAQIYVRDKYKIWDNAHHAPNRILQLMRSYYEEANLRIADMNEIRFIYEDSPHYEMGYIMGEIIERYSRVVEHNQRMVKFLSDTAPDHLKHVELIQKEYFEVYHMVRMLHEVPRKYKYTIEFQDGTKSKHQLTMKDIQAMQETQAALERRKVKEKRKRMKENAKLRELYMKGVSQSEYGKRHQPYNKWWPIDYGWEIENWW